MENQHGVSITAFQIENTMRLKALSMEPQPTGLTIIGGGNAQGKTSALSALAWALGGAKFQPTDAHRDGAMNPPEISVTLSNGIKVTRRGKNAALYVTDPSGQKAGQSLLDSFISQFALNLPKFLNASETEKAKILLDTLGIEEQLDKLSKAERDAYDKRHAIGQIATSKRKHANELPECADAPPEPVSISALIQQQQAILATNGENQKKRSQLAHIEQLAEQRQRTVADLESKLTEARVALDQINGDLATARRSAQDLEDESTAEIESSIANIEAINSQVAANQAKQHAADEAAEYESQYEALTAEIEQLRDRRMSLLATAEWPLDGMAVDDDKRLTFQDKHWDCMSGAERYRVATAIVAKLQPACKFAFVDSLEQMDLDTLSQYNDWLKAQGMQVIGTRVSTGGECTIVIEDGLPQGQTYADVVTGVSANGEQGNGEDNNWGEEF